MYIRFFNKSSFDIKEFITADEDFVCRKEENGMYVVRYGSNLVYCDYEAMKILEIKSRCKDANEFNNIVNNTFNEEAKILISEFFRCFKEKKFFDINNQLLDLPILVQWRITEECNLRCYHCYQKEYLEKDNNDVMTILKSIMNLKPFYVTLTGGEPTVVKELETVLMELSKNRIPVHLISNGMFSDEDFEWLSELGNIIFTISIDGQETEHEMTRGKGTFSRLEKRIRQLTMSGCKVITNTVITTYNYINIPELVWDLLDMGVRKIKLSNLIWNDQRYDIQTGLELSKTQFFLLENNLKLIDKEIKEKGINCTILYKPVKDGSLSTDIKDGDMCLGGISKANVQANGDVYPCVYVSEIFKIGNINEMGFGKKWMDSSKRKEFIDMNRIYLKEKNNCGVYCMELYDTIIK
jgi:radical SAM protein with 4Fe4S-binding SPASM domain